MPDRDGVRQIGRRLFFVSPETLSRSNLGRLKEGSRVNLERAVTLGTRLSGHLVQGHVDGLGKLVSVEPRAESFFVQFEIPARLARYCVEKGSIAFNGVSLTINKLEQSLVSITLIPHTWTHTQFSRCPRRRPRQRRSRRPGQIRREPEPTLPEVLKSHVQSRSSNRFSQKRQDGHPRRRRGARERGRSRPARRARHA